MGRAWLSRYLPLPLRATRNALASCLHHAQLYNALRSRRMPSAEDLAVTEGTHDALDASDEQALKQTGNSRMTGARWCSPTPRKVTTPRRPW